MAAVVVASLRALDAEITSVAPRRTLPTWYKGDKRHQGYPSGHNADDTPGVKAEYQDADNIPEIRAGDYRLPLNAEFTPEEMVQYLVAECRAGRITWIAYIIFKRRIWSASSDWVTRVYNGSNPHDEHVHVSSKSDTKSENSTKKVGLAKLLVPKTPQKARMIKVNGELPELKQGMKDPVNGSMYVKRIQTLLNWILPGELPLKVDGDYGEKTAEGLQVAMKGYKPTKADGSIVGLAEWQRLVGF